MSTIWLPSLSPPPLPAASVYTANYCEENVFLLAKQFLEDPTVSMLWEVHVLFLSNRSKSVRTACSFLFRSVLRVGECAPLLRLLDVRTQPS